MRLPARRLVALAIGFAALAGVVPGEPAGVARAVGDEVQIDVPTPGPLGPITVIGDSVLVGAAIEPSLPRLLQQAGWGPVRYRAGLGYSAGNQQPPTSPYSAANWIRWWKAAGWDAPNVMVNLGNNDVGWCRASIACNAASIRHVLDAIGPGHHVWWSKITRFPFLTAEGAGYNAALELVASERDDLVLWDWPAAQAAEQIPLSWDEIHLRDAAAYRRRSVLMAADATRRLAVAHRTGGDAALPTPAAAPAEYLPIAPTRAVDTRVLPGGRPAAGGVVPVDLTSIVPADATAVAVNITAVDAAAPGFLTGYPCDQPRPPTSSGNHLAASARSTMSVLPLTSSRQLCVYASRATDVVVDVQGAMVPRATRLTPTPPTRLLDTRLSGRSSELVVPVPAGAAAVALNIAVTGPAAAGFVTAHPCGGTRPLVANVTFAAGETISGGAYVPAGAGGAVCVYANVPTDVVVDLTGTFAGDGALSFVAATPSRTYDTRDGTGGWTGIQGSGQSVDVRVSPPEAQAVTGVLTMVTPLSPGFLTAHGCTTAPPTASVNAWAGDVVANAVTVGVAAGGRMCILSSATTSVVFDTTGWWI